MTRTPFRPVKLDALVRTSRAAAASPGRLEKVAKLTAFLKQLSADEAAIAIGFFTGWPRQGRIGVGWATAAEARETPAAATATLELLDVDRAFDALQSAKGKGSAALRFARVKGYRPDKRAEEVDTIDAVRAFLPD
ncbi:MAG: hypothetical protein ACREON_04635 [Gemmatimonadaceae bacterium]